MNNTEAKFLLHAYRPGGGDASDPSLSAALTQVKTDPALAAWFAREQTHAAAVTAKLRQVEPPPGLRDSILAGMHAGSARVRQRTQQRRILMFGLAACFAGVLIAAAWWRFAPVPGATLDEFAANVVNRGFFLQERSADLAHLRSWLATRGTPLPGELPREFAQLRALGCRTLDFDGRDVSLVCFERGGKEFHVFIARRENRPAASPPLFPQLRERRGHIVAAWADASNDYVLVSDASKDEVRQLL